MGDRDEAVQALITQAKAAWRETWQQIRWDYWVTLKWRGAISAETANAHLERLIRDLQRNGPTGHRHPTIRVVAGYHPDPFPNAHAMVSLSRRHRAQFLNAVEFASWLSLYWAHGTVWADVFDGSKRHPEHGGAIEYLSRDPGTVVFG